MRLSKAVFKMLALILAFSLAALSWAGDLKVFAAASLTRAFTEIGKSFEEAHPGDKVSFNFDGSQRLSLQLQEGASGDVFASANQKEMKKMLDGGLVEKGAAKVFLQNKLAIIVSKKALLMAGKPEDLTKPGLKLILAGAAVPVGNYSRASLKKIDAKLGGGYYDAVMKNLVSEETNVEKVVTKVCLGEADAGIVYLSDAIGREAELDTILIPDDLNVVGEYPIAILKGSANPALAKSFVDYVSGPEGQKALKKYGFCPME